MAELLRIEHLRKIYGGRRALADAVMTIEPGKIVGLMGPNGSGKTSLLNIIAGLAKQDAGRMTYQEGWQGRSAVAYLPDAMSYPAWMRVRDAFGYYKEMYPDFSEEAAQRFIRILEIEPQDKISYLSKGAKERVGIALTFSRQAKLYVLDEPLGGVDPVARERIVDAILAMELESTSILIATQLIRDIERLFDEVYFLGGGVMQRHVNCEQMRENEHKTVETAYLEVFGHA